MNFKIILKYRDQELSDRELGIWWWGLCLGIGMGGVAGILLMVVKL